MKMLLRYSIFLLLICMSSVLSAQDFKVSQSLQKQNDIKGGWHVVGADPNVSGLTPEGGAYANIHCVDSNTNIRYFWNYLSQGWDTLAAVDVAFGNGLFDLNNEGDTIAISTYNQNQDLIQQTNGNQWELDYTDGARKREIFIRDDQMGFLMDQGDGDLFRLQSTYVLGQHSVVMEAIDDGSEAEVTFSGASAALRGDNGTDVVSFEVDADAPTGFRIRTKGGAANDLIIAAQDGAGNIEYENLTDLMSLGLTNPTDSTLQFSINSAGNTIFSNIASIKSVTGSVGGGDDWGVQTVASDGTLTGDGASTLLSVNQAGLSIGWGQLTAIPTDLSDGDNFLASRALVIAGGGSQAQFDLLDNNASNMASLNFVGGNGVTFADDLGRLQINFEDTFVDDRQIFQSGSIIEYRLQDANDNLLASLPFLEGSNITFSNNLNRIEISANDNQAFDEFLLVGNTLSASLERDGQAPVSVDLSGVDTDISAVNFNGATGELEITEDGNTVSDVIYSQDLDNDLSIGSDGGIKFQRTTDIVVEISYDNIPAGASFSMERGYITDDGTGGSYYLEGVSWVRHGNTSSFSTPSPDGAFNARVVSGISTTPTVVAFTDYDATFAAVGGGSDNTIPYGTDVFAIEVTQNAATNMEGVTVRLRFRKR